MDKNYSYVDFLRAVGQSKRVKGSEKLLDEIYLDLFLNHLLRMQQEKYIMELIDKSLDRKDEATFYRLTEQLKELQYAEQLQAI